MMPVTATVRRPFSRDIVASTLAGIRPRQIGFAMLFGLTAYVLIFLVESVHTLPFIPSLGMLRGVIDFQFFGLILMLAIAIADRAVDEGASRRTAYVAAAIIGCIASVLMRGMLDSIWFEFITQAPPIWRPHEPALRTHTVGSAYTRSMYAFLQRLLLGGAAIFFYAQRRSANKTAALLHEVELERIHKSKLALQSRLQAMQARVEPQFLFSTLVEVRDLYRHDTAAADRVLDELIAYLRAAMPKMRDTSSTVGQEIELVSAYLAIVRARLGDRLDYSIDLPSDITDARLPPMMLLPLVDHAVVHGTEVPRDRAVLAVEVSTHGDRLRLLIATNGSGFVQSKDASLSSIRERLAGLYGSDASLMLRAREGGGFEAVLEIPFDRASRSRLARSLRDDNIDAQSACDVSGT